MSDISDDRPMHFISNFLCAVPVCAELCLMGGSVLLLDFLQKAPALLPVTLDQLHDEGVIAALVAAGDVGRVGLVDHPHLEMVGDRVEHDAGRGIATPARLVTLANAAGDVIDVGRNLHPSFRTRDVVRHQIFSLHNPPW